MKENARLQNLAKRNGFSEKELEEKSRLACTNVLSMPEFAKAKRAMLYYGVKSEVRTRQLIEQGLKEGKEIFLPATDFEKRKIFPVRISSLGDLKETANGLMEPVSGESLDSSGLGLIVVPGIAFDRQGNRIGSGRGFYDSLLRRTSTRVKLVGLCFSENFLERLPSESHDVKMDFVVTDRGIFRTG